MAQDVGVDAVDLPDEAGGEHGLRIPCRVEAPVAQDDDGVADAGRMGQVVQCGDNREPCVREPAQQSEDAQLRVGVQVVGRLVEEQQLRLLRECAGESHPLPLAAGQGREATLGERGAACDLQCLLDAGGVVRIRPAERQQRLVGHTTQLDDLANGQPLLGVGVLLDEREHARTAARSQPQQVLA
ncbi:hypothetical protein FM105_02285 [Brevibacterium yomogidense]|uniref:Uncharacterized protein n=1 Tax=Brevibacterium yomogidense TaxID=946573 RepID=A0A1X6WY76_9MICO|nr:hypothetical protein FM105_02285 [Brevibacterium yomogidense]